MSHRNHARRPDWMARLDDRRGLAELSIPNIPSVSDDINLRLDALLAEPANRRARLGALVMDHVTPARVQAVVATNEP